MSYKTGGEKARWEPPTYYGYGEKYTVYTALESTSDINSYAIADENGNIIPGFSTFLSEDDSAKGRESLIDVLYYLKHHGPGTYPVSDANWQDIVIQEMTPEEMDKIFIKTH